MKYILCVVYVWERKKARKKGEKSHILIMRVLSLSRFINWEWRER